jgi:hypothetical protein
LQRPSRFNSRDPGSVAGRITMTPRILDGQFQMQTKLFFQIVVMAVSREGGPEAVKPFANSAYEIAHFYASPCSNLFRMVAIRSHALRSFAS